MFTFTPFSSVKLTASNKVMLNIAFLFVILISQNDIQRNKLRLSGITEFRPLSRYWEQTLTMFGNVPLEKTAHA